MGLIMTVLEVGTQNVYKESSQNGCHISVKELNNKRVILFYAKKQ